jgi:hypothetical protein
MALGEVVVDLERVVELDRRFFEFALVRVAFAAFKVFLFLLIGVAVAAGGETQRK